MSASALHARPMPLRYLADDFSLLVLRRRSGTSMSRETGTGCTELPQGSPTFHVEH